MKPKSRAHLNATYTQAIALKDLKNYISKRNIIYATLTELESKKIKENDTIKWKGKKTMREKYKSTLHIARQTDAILKEKLQNS